MHESVSKTEDKKRVHDIVNTNDILSTLVLESYVLVQEQEHYWKYVLSNMKTYEIEVANNIQRTLISNSMSAWAG